MAVTETAFEQLYLELINQARTDPAGAFARVEAARAADPVIQVNLNFFGVDMAALEQQFAALTAVAPLAWNDALQISAETHSQGMLDFDQQSHFLPGEPGILERFQNAGYTNLSRAAENIFAFDRDPLFGFTAFFVDWGFDDVDDPNGDFASTGDGIQDPPGHRNAIMSADFQEVGVAGLQQTDPNANVGPVATTQHFGARFNYNPQFLGVVFDDLDGDAFYDIGEGLANIAISIEGAGGAFQTQSSASGGWQFEVPAGQYTITFSGQGLDGEVIKAATLGADNVKVDARADEAAPAGPIEGGAGNDSLVGTAGDDVIRGLGGDDILAGGGGGDMLEGGPGFDIADYGGSPARVVINLGTGFRSGGDAAGDFFDCIEGLTGSAFGDVLVGNAGDNILEGGAGGDDLRGGDGVDTASYANSNARVLINLETGYRTGGDATGDRFDSIENLIGSDFDDVLVGTAGVNHLEGGAGGDLLRGGSGFDTASYAGSDARVVINLEVGFRSGGDAAGDRFDSIEGLAGSAHNDILVGTSGDNVLEGGAGGDVLRGGGGQDLASYAGSSSRVIINLEVGYRSGGDASGDRFDSIEGVIGSAHDDILVGTTGADVLRGGAGDDILRGGAGADVFEITQNLDRDEIRDFADGVDRISLTAYGFSDFATDVAPLLTTINGAAAIDFLGGGVDEVVLIAGVAVGQLDASDFNL